MSAAKAYFLESKTIKYSGSSYFSPIDLHFGKFITSFTSDQKDDLFLAAALVSRHLREGHSCINLGNIAGRTIFKSDDEKEIISCPELFIWRKSVAEASCTGAPGEFKPLILDEKNRLYLQRYWQYERDIVHYIRNKTAIIREPAIGISELEVKIQQYFPDAEGSEVDWQKMAAVSALFKEFLIITGSPGTGKTSTVTKIMALLIDAENRPMRIALAAPTGKAASRLQESVKKTKKLLNCSAEIIDMIPDEAQTIHRLLGSISNSPYFFSNEKNTLSYDLVIIDEASMVDLPLLSKLISTLLPNSRLILLGDNHQLASVSAGFVLGDICSCHDPNVFSHEFIRQIEPVIRSTLKEGMSEPGIQDSIVELQKNYRFPENSGIDLLSRAVKNGQMNAVREILDENKYTDIHFNHSKDNHNLIPYLNEIIMEYYAPYIKEVSGGHLNIEKIFELFEKFRILCALRSGNWGTQKINAHVETILDKAGLISRQGNVYEGMPVMILRNNYSLRLFNGDVGIILKDIEADNQLRAFFYDDHGLVRKIIPGRLPEYETVWALTVHKSQGSEYDRVFLMLSEYESPILTRELLYTGITRARKYLDVWASKDIIHYTLGRSIERESGLVDALK